MALKLNIGCECNLIPGWQNIDSRRMTEQVIELDIRVGLPYPNNSVEEIYGGNFLDHLTYFEGLAFLRECYRVLHPDKVAQFSVMNLDRIINQFLLSEMGEFDKLQPPIFSTFDNSTKFATFLLGNLAYGEKEYTGHKMLYNSMSLCCIGTEAGFNTKTIKPDFGAFPWSVENPEYESHNLYVVFKKG